MDYKFGCVVDADRNYVVYVRIALTDDGTETIVGYDLKAKERIIALPYPCDIVKAQANEDDSEWEETATPEEIAAYKAAHQLWRLKRTN